MKGVPVQLSGGRRDAYINFEAAEKRFTGNGGCNQVSGNYSLEKKNIHFGEVISTKMSCEDIQFENTFLSTLNSIDHYEQRGNDLLLKKKKDVLLRFTARYSFLNPNFSVITCETFMTWEITLTAQSVNFFVVYFYCFFQQFDNGHFINFFRLFINFVKYLFIGAMSEIMVFIF